MFLDFNSRELKVIELVSQGWWYREIAVTIGRNSRLVKNIVHRVYEKAGLKHNIATLRRWAIENSLDGPMPDTPETRPVPGTPAPRRQRIKLGRIGAVVDDHKFAVDRFLHSPQLLSAHCAHRWLVVSVPSRRRGNAERREREWHEKPWRLLQIGLR